ncbi:MAG: molybdopterin-dependent oxidoreductase, partial [Coriobacteriaceae bacterium]|nr:molybdopterin-dependent oxidoreductase [Coriobacteriaceae bacterium]
MRKGRAMARYGMLIDLKRCSGCFACVVACKQYFGTAEGIDYNQGAITEWGQYPHARRAYVATMCNHCENPPCLSSCKTGSTFKSAFGPVLTRPELCNSCGACVNACPYGQRFLSREPKGAFAGCLIPGEKAGLERKGKAEKCTLCVDRIEIGLEPFCVAQCPAKARVFGDYDDPSSEINVYAALYGAITILGTSLSYVVPEGYDLSLLPRGYDHASNTLIELGIEDLPRPRTPKDADYRELRDRLMAIRDKMRIEPSVPDDPQAEYRYSYCTNCNHMPRCGVKALVKAGQIIRLEKRQDYGNELLCPMGNASVQDVYAPNRVLHPLRRINPKGMPAIWKQISWDEALAEMAKEFLRVKEEYGADKVLFMTGDPKEPRSALQRLCYSFGSPNFGTESSTCNTAAELALRLMYGTRSREALALTQGCLPDINETKVCIIWANNPANSAPSLFGKMLVTREFSDIPFIVVDPRVTATSQCFADVHLQLRSGTDGALALFFANYLIEHDAYDKGFIEEWAYGFEEYRACAAAYDVGTTSRICGLDPHLLVKAAALLAEGARKGPIAIKGSGANASHTNGLQNHRAVMLLLPLTGSLDVEGGAVFPSEPWGLDAYGGSFAFNRAHELLPGLTNNGTARIDNRYFPVWAQTDWDGQNQLNKLPEYVRDGQVKAAVMLGGNCIMWPQSHEYQEAFKEMEFVAAADFRYNPWTHDYVDMLLPAAMSYERMAPLSMNGRELFLREPMIEPRGEARSDFRIIADLAVALGLGNLFWGGGAEAEERCLDEILRTGLEGTCRQVTVQDLREAVPYGVRVPLRNGVKYKKYESGLLRKDGKPGFETPTGKVEFFSTILDRLGFEGTPAYHEPSYSPFSTPQITEEYPLVVTCGARVPYYSNSKERELPWLRRFCPDPLVKVNSI